MKAKSNVARMIVFLVTAFLLGGQLSAYAEERAWVKYANGTLTFQYGEKMSLGEDEYWLNEGNDTPGWNSKRDDVTQVVFDESFAQARPTSCYRWFYNFYNLEAITDIEYLNTSDVTDMNSMFYSCYMLETLDVSKFNTSNVTDMGCMFMGCNCLNSLNVSKFETSNVENMSCMFQNCYNIETLDLSKFNTSNVTFMSGMFMGCNSLKSLNLSNFNTSKVTSMSNMFHQCNSLTSLDLSNFDTSNVEYMDNMFTYCSGLISLNLSKFNTSKVKYMDFMFTNCKGLISLDLFNFDTSNVEDMSSMFSGCEGLISLNVSKFNTSKVSSMRAMFESCLSLKSLNLSNFDTSKLTNMQWMFSYCSGLTSLDLSNFDTSKVTNIALMFYQNSGLKAIYFGDKFNVDNLSSISSTDNMLSNCPATLYCSPSQYQSFNCNNFITSFGNSVKPYVSINSKAEYGTLCVPFGSTLEEGCYTGFDKLYTVTAADKNKRIITLTEAKSIEPGVAYVYHKNLSTDATESVITFDVDADASAVTTPNDKGMLKGTFESIVAPANKYILQTDGYFHPVAEGNSTLKVGAYRAYLDLPEIGGIDEAKAFRMVFDDSETTAINGIVDNAKAETQAEYFDFMGHKVNTPQRGGIYIANGKKVVYNE